MEKRVYLHRLYNATGTLVVQIPEETENILEPSVTKFANGYKYEVILLSETKAAKYKIPLLSRKLKNPFFNL